MARFYLYAIVVMVWWPLAGRTSAAVAQVQGESRPVFSMPNPAQFQIILPNGLVAFAVPDDGATGRVTLSALVRVGRADDDVQGAAEMVALMLATRGPCWMFPGTYRATMDRYNAELQVAMDSEITQVTLTVNEQFVSGGLRLLSGILREPCIDEEGLESFRTQVSRQATAARPEGGGFAEALNQFQRTLYDDHPYSPTVSLSDATRLAVTDAQEFFEEYFTPTNVTLATGGNFDLPNMVETIDQRFGDWARSDRPTFFDRIGEKAPLREERVVDLVSNSAETVMVMGQTLGHVPPEDVAAFDLLIQVLGTPGGQGRLNTAVQMAGVQVSGAGFQFEHKLRGPSSFLFSVSGPAGAATDLRSVARLAIKSIQEDVVSPEELRKAKDELLSRWHDRVRNGPLAAFTFAANWSRYGSHAFLTEYDDAINALSDRDLRSVAQRYLNADRMLLVVLQPTGAGL